METGFAKEDYFHRAAGNCIEYIFAAQFQKFSVKICHVLALLGLSVWKLQTAANKQPTSYYLSGSQQKVKPTSIMCFRQNQPISCLTNLEEVVQGHSSPIFFQMHLQLEEWKMNPPCQQTIEAWRWDVNSTYKTWLTKNGKKKNAFCSTLHSVLNTLVTFN